MITAAKDFQEHFEEIWIEREMIKKSISYLNAQKEFQAWKNKNKKEYKNQFDNYIDEMKGF